MFRRDHRWNWSFFNTFLARKLFLSFSTCLRNRALWFGCLRQCFGRPLWPFRPDRADKIFSREEGPACLQKRTRLFCDVTDDLTGRQHSNVRVVRDFHFKTPLSSFQKRTHAVCCKKTRHFRLCKFEFICIPSWNQNLF